VWDKEYSDNKWHFAENSAGDCIYPYLEKYVRNGSILDIGCGSGNTANEMTPTYQSYVGVDISKEALEKAAKRSERNGRQDKNRFACSDFLDYVPTSQFDVILFRESMYHVPMHRIKEILDYYAKYLKENGVLIVRMFIGASMTSADGKKHRPAAMIGIMETEFEVVEKAEFDTPGRPAVIVLRPKVQAKR
jgi:2-polyprenyl-3-methyl-5-hydroxy-6-metoxy-1,4-benzoquinol methylase